MKGDFGHRKQDTMDMEVHAFDTWMKSRLLWGGWYRH